MSAGQGTAPELVAAGLPALRLLEDQAEEFVRAAKAPSTLRAYRSDWDHFQRWCAAAHAVSPPGQPRNRGPVPHRAGGDPPAGDHDPAVDGHHQSACRLPDTLRPPPCSSRR